MRLLFVLEPRLSCRQVWMARLIAANIEEIPSGPARRSPWRSGRQRRPAVIPLPLHTGFGLLPPGRAGSRRALVVKVQATPGALLLAGLQWRLTVGAVALKLCATVGASISGNRRSAFGADILLAVGALHGPDFENLSASGAGRELVGGQTGTARWATGVIRVEFAQAAWADASSAGGAGSDQWVKA